jgi:hypothetical protein
MYTSGEPFSLYTLPLIRTIIFTENIQTVLEISLGEGKERKLVPPNPGPGQ